MPLARDRQEDLAEVAAGPASGLDCVAVGAQRDHLLWGVRAAMSEVTDVVNFQDRVAAVGDVGGLSSAAGVLAAAVAAQQDGLACRS